MDLSPFLQLITQLQTEDNAKRKTAEDALEEAKTKIPDQLIVALILMVSTETIDPQVQIFPILKSHFLKYGLFI